MFPPATNPCIDPPSFCAADMEASDDMFSFPSRCSRIANVDASRRLAASLESRDIGVARFCRIQVDACRSKPLRKSGTMLFRLQILSRELVVVKTVKIVNDRDASVCEIATGLLEPQSRGDDDQFMAASGTKTFKLSTGAK